MTVQTILHVRDAQVAAFTLEHHGDEVVVFHNRQHVNFFAATDKNSELLAKIFIQLGNRINGASPPIGTVEFPVWSWSYRGEDLERSLVEIGIQVYKV